MVDKFTKQSNSHNTALQAVDVESLTDFSVTEFESSDIGIGSPGQPAHSLGFAKSQDGGS